MTLIVQKWGDSLGIRIPRGIANNAHLQEGMAVYLSTDSAKLTLCRSGRKPKYTLDELLAQVTDENRQELIDWGAPRGKEVW